MEGKLTCNLILMKYINIILISHIRKTKLWGCAIQDSSVHTATSEAVI